jgi:hypothetical protein
VSRSPSRNSRITTNDSRDFPASDLRDRIEPWQTIRARAKFKDAARELECDEDEARWDERLKKIAGQKPVPDKPE